MSETMRVLVLGAFGLGISLLVMVATFKWAKRLDNYGIVDAVWSLSFAFLTLFFVSFGSADPFRKVLLLGIVSAWSLRLGIYLYRRVMSHLDVEDTRYAAMRIQWKDRFDFEMLRFYLIQGVSVSLLTVPFLLSASNPAPEIHVLEMLGACVVLLGLLGESIADFQMARFRAVPTNKGKVCQVGLWRFSRHPNYFFESVIWWGFYLFACASPGGVWTVFAPLTILYLLLKVTGVPMSEEQSLKSRGEAYREYQRTTSVFVPWFRRST